MTTTSSLISALQAWTALSMSRSMRSFLMFCKENNLSLSQMGVLFHLNRKGVCAVSEIGEHLDVTSPAASQILDRMVQQNLVFRSEDPTDRRVKQIAMTRKGRQVMEDSIRAQQSWWSDLEHHLTPDEKVQVVAALEILVAKTAGLQELQPEKTNE